VADGDNRRRRCLREQGLIRLHLILIFRFAIIRLASQRCACEEKQKEPQMAGATKMIKNRKQIAERRTKRLNVFFDVREYEQLLGEARLARMKPSELMRQKFFNAAPPSVPKVNLDAWTKLSSASANLNQMARYLNSGMRLDIDEVSVLLASFRMSLVFATRG